MRRGWRIAQLVEQRSPKTVGWGSSPSSPARLFTHHIMTNPFTAIRQRWTETVSELKKSSWPNRREL